LPDTQGSSSSQAVEQSPSPLPVSFLYPVLGWLGGIVIAAWWSPSPLLLLGLFAMVFLLGWRLKFTLPLLICLFCLGGAFRLELVNYKKDNQLSDLMASKQTVLQTCQGTVIRELGTAQDRYLTQLTALKDTKVKARAYLYINQPLRPGDRFAALALLRYKAADPVLDTVTPFSYLAQNRMSFVLNPVFKFRLTGRDNSYWLQGLRQWMLRSLDSKLGEGGGFGKALLLGDRTADADFVEQLTRGGLLHLIAISGLHVFFLYFIVVTLLNLVLPRRWSELIFLLLSIVYAALCMWSPPVLRAVVMIGLVVLAKWLQRLVSPLQTICLSLFIITLADPYSLFSPGLQLSYLCILTLVYAIPQWRVEMKGWGFWIRTLTRTGLQSADIIIVSTLISLLIIPLTLFHFQRGSFNGIIGNLLGIPLVGLLLPLTLLLLILPQHWLVFLWMKASFLLLYGLFHRWAEWVANLPLYVDTVSVPLSMVLAAYLIAGAILLRLKYRFSRNLLIYGLLLIALGLGFWHWLPQQRSFSLTCFNAGMGECAWVELPDGKNLMIDTGPAYVPQKEEQGSNWFRQTGYAWFRIKKVDTVDLLILSHLDDDHSGGLMDVCSRLRVRNLFISAYSAQLPQWRSWYATGVFRRTAIHIVSDTLTVALGGCRVSFLHPAAGFHSPDENENSLVARIDYKDFSALFTGDIDTRVEQRLVDEMPERLDCDWLKVPHHGSANASSEAFIRAVSPEQVVIEAGVPNRFGFPHRQTLKRYEQFGLTPKVTGNGSIRLYIK